MSDALIWLESRRDGDTCATRLMLRIYATGGPVDVELPNVVSIGLEKIDGHMRPLRATVEINLGSIGRPD